MNITYIALLRAINVGGHTVKMEYLRELFTELGFTNVRTYIQTGNVFFDTEESDETTLTKKIEEHLESSLGYAVPVMLRTVSEFEQALAAAPFKNKEPDATTRFNIVFLTSPPSADLNLPIVSPKGDCEIVAVVGSDAYVIWHIVDGRVGNFGPWLDKQLGSKGTSRFYHTTLKMLEAAKQ